MNNEAILLELAERQHGVVAVWQARQIGMTRSEFRNACAGPHWQPITSHVLRVTGAERTDAQRVMAAVLDAGFGAVLSHIAGAAWWRVPGFRLRQLHVSRPRGGTRRASSLAVIHELRAVPGEHVCVVDGVPVVSPSLVIYQLAATVHPKRAERACDNAWSRGLLGDGTLLHALLNDLAKQGRNGTTVLRDILESRPIGYIPPASGLESRFVGIVAEAGDPPFDRQVNVGDGVGWVGRVDFKDPALPLVVELNSALFHLALLDRESDEARYARLRAAGFEVLVLWDEEVWMDPRAVLRKVREARARARYRRAA